MTFALDPDTGQPLRSASGDLIRHTDFVEEVAQRVRVRLRIIRGEVLTRQTIGLPADDDGDVVLLEKGVSPVEVASVVRGEIRGVEGILRVDSVVPAAEPDEDGRLPVSFRATVDTGAQIEGSELV